MVAVQVSFATVVSGAKLVEHSICGRVAELEAAAVSHDIRLKAAIDTPPSVPQEAQQPYPAMVSIVSALSTGATAHVMFTLARDPVGLAGSTSG